jgi:hypothetical protein
MFVGEDDQRERVEPVGAASKTAQLRLVEGAVVVAAAAAAFATAAQVQDLREVQARGVIVQGVALAGEENLVAEYQKVEEAPDAEDVQEKGVAVAVMASPLVVAERVGAAGELRTLRTQDVVNAEAQVSPNGELNV